MSAQHTPGPTGPVFDNTGRLMAAVGPLTPSGMRAELHTHSVVKTVRGQPQYVACHCSRCIELRAAIAKATGSAS